MPRSAEVFKGFPNARLGTLHPTRAGTCYCPYFVTEETEARKDELLLMKTHGDHVLELDLGPRVFLVSTPEMVKGKEEIIGLAHTYRVPARVGI